MIMSNSASSIRPAIHYLHRSLKSVQCLRTFTFSSLRTEETAIQSHPPTVLDPSLVYTRKDERALLRSGVSPIGSRRRRAALNSTQDIPFEQLPYQCFQEARKVLQADRQEKLRQIKNERTRIANSRGLDPAKCGGEVAKKMRIAAQERYLEELKIQADINDPLIKKRFEDGEGDMSRPIYRFLANRQWREYKRKIVIQRITQFNLVPDILPHLDPTVSISTSFGRRHVQPGEFVDSRVSEASPRLDVRVFDKGSRNVSVVVIDSDVPNLQTDGFDYRCHYLAVNIPLSPSSPSISLPSISQDQTVFPWLPPHAQKGSPYHRLSIFILQQPESSTLKPLAIRECYQRDGFNLRSFNDKYLVKPVGATLFRSIWDEGTAGVMTRAGLEGANIELKRKKPESLPYKKKDGARYR